MKKKLLGVLLASFALVSVSQARFYIGVEGGYSAEGSYVPNKEMKADSFSFILPSLSTIKDSFDKKKGFQGYSIGAVVGTEHFFGKYFGLRWGIGGGYSSFKDGPSYIDAGLNTDLMVNFINTGSFSIGVFGGVGLDYAYMLDKMPKGENAEFYMSKHMLDLTGRVGLSALVASHHRIEFVAKLPIGSMAKTGKEVMGTGYGEMLLGSQASHSRTTFGASYKFVF